jgi:hypothetical protein
LRSSDIGATPAFSKADPLSTNGQWWLSTYFRSSTICTNHSSSTLQLLLKQLLGLTKLSQNYIQVQHRPKHTHLIVSVSVVHVLYLSYVLRCGVPTAYCGGHMEIQDIRSCNDRIRYHSKIHGQPLSVEVLSQ